MLWVWVAMLGVLFSALAPALSHAMPSSAPLLDTVQVCTMEGMQTIVVDKEQPFGAGSSHPFEHCPYCALHGGASLPPPSAGLTLTLLPLGEVRPPLFYQVARPLFTWSTANPRAPPSQD
ncbi:conserved exported hypothetical protein [Massilia sp. 9I]|nr:conserved exported hypothetical protein [Massilia sp. 9I]